VVTQRNWSFQEAITGRHAALVLHDPGTRTIVGPVLAGKVLIEFH
jgi:hypothetical protein